MYTAHDARDRDQAELDRIIEAAVKSRNGPSGRPCSTHLRVHIGDPWCSTIESELRRRGFVNIKVPDIDLYGDVYFEWSE